MSLLLTDFVSEIFAYVLYLFHCICNQTAKCLFELALFTNSENAWTC